MRAKHGQIMFIGLGLAGLVVLLGLAIAILPHALVSESARCCPDPGAQAKAENDVRGTLLTTFIGLGAFFTGAVALLSYRLNQRGQVTDRFTAAIAQLGDPRLDIRLGGIYALEQIAIDSRDLHPPTMEILTAFIREHSHELNSNSLSADADEFEIAVALLRERAADLEEQSEAGRSEALKSVPALKTMLAAIGLRPDIQAIATVLSRRKVRYDSERFIVDLRYAVLRRAYFRRASLKGAFLVNADLRNARFTGADLRNAKFNLAQLQQARLWSTNVTDADFEDANLDGAVFARVGTNEMDAKGLKWEQLRSARGWEKAVLPSYLGSPPADLASKPDQTR